MSSQCQICLAGVCAAVNRLSLFYSNKIRSKQFLSVISALYSKKYQSLKMSEYMDIDGSLLEGGGQILRISISLSAILGIPVRISKIRSGRSKPGLAAQHCKGIHLVGEMCQAKIKGAEIGSTVVEFAPKKLRGGQYFADPHTAGSISLLLQVALPCALMADGPVTFDLRGGTNADMAPQIDYMDQVFRHALKHFGADFDVTIHRRGYFPKGGGQVTVNVNPVRSLKSVTLTNPGVVEKIQGTSFVAGVLPINMAHQMAEGAKQVLRSMGEANINCYKEDSRIAIGNCNGMILTCTTSTGHVLGSDALGKRGAEPRQAGAAAAQELKKDIEAGACLDQHSQPCENTFKSFYYPENEDCSSDEEGTLGFKIKQAIAKKRGSNNINTFFEIPKKKPKVYKKQSTVSQTRSDGVAYISSGQEDGAYANHLIKIEVYDMQKIKNISPLEYWKHCDLRVKYYTVGEDDPLEKSARDVIYDITKQLASKDKCVKYFLDSDKKQ